MSGKDVADGLELDGQVEEAVQMPAHENLTDVDAGDRERGGERLARRAQVVVLGVEHQHRAEAVEDGVGGHGVAVGRARGDRPGSCG